MTGAVSSGTGHAAGHGAGHGAGHRPPRGRPASLRGRVVLGVLALLAVLLAALFATVDVALRERLDADLRTRLTDRVALAQQLDGYLSAEQLVDRLRGDGVTVQLCSASDSGSGATGTVSSASPSSATNGSTSSQPTCYEAAAVPAVPAAGPPTPGSMDRPTGGPPGHSRPSKPAKPSAPVSTSAQTVQSSGPLLYVRTTLPSTRQVLTLAVDRAQVGATLQRLVVLEVIGGVVALLLAALLLRWVVGSALRPLDRMTGLATSIAAGDRGRRLRTGRPDTELGRTAAAFDDMLDELESALAEAAAAETRLRRFLSDVSHELRTPLAGVAATAETLLREATTSASTSTDSVRPDGDARERREQAYVRLIRETRRANRLVDDLLTVARLDTGMQLRTSSVDLVEVTTDDLQRVQAISPGLTVDRRLPETAEVNGDRVRLTQILSNLLDNATRAAGSDGRLAVRLRRTSDQWWLEVADDGAGVPEADRERIFERLVRLDDSRSRQSGGFGLGLPIARALARAHAGDLTCVGRDPDLGGALFRLTLPADGLRGDRHRDHHGAAHGDARSAASAV